MLNSVNAPSHIYYSKRRRRDQWLIASLCVSLIAHFTFIYMSTSWQVADVGVAEESVETLFNVRLQKLESRNFTSRPTQEHLIREPERVLPADIDQLNNQIPRSVQSGINDIAPPSMSNAIPAWDDEEVDNLFEDDQAANRLISSEFSQKSIQDFDAKGGREAVVDEIDPNYIPLTGRGGGQRRILDGLPAPVLRSNPVASRSLQMVLDKNLPPPTPDLEISEPPIELPPVTEFLPITDLMGSNPATVDLQKVEDAKEEIKDRFVNLDNLLWIDLQTYHHVGGDGYFMVRIRPLAKDDRLRVLPKDVVFVVDASASMGKRRMKVIIEELEGLMRQLRPDDRFNIVGFKRSVKKFTDTLAPVTSDNMQLAKRFIRPLAASGKTDIYTSLQPLIRLGTERARPLTLFFVSDGRPTVGVVNSRKIINSLTKHQGPSTSIFCVGTGDAINRYLLDMLAFRNRGLVAFEQSRSKLPPVLKSMYAYIEDPLLLQVSADFLGVEKTEVYPKRLPHLYQKGEIRIWGRLRDEKSFTLRLVGEAFDEQKEVVLELKVPERDNGSYEIARQWAFHKIYHIVGRMVDEGEQPEFLEQIRFLSRTYRIVTPYSEQFEK